MPNWIWVVPAIFVAAAIVGGIFGHEGIVYALGWLAHFTRG